MPERRLLYVCRRMVEKAADAEHALKGSYSLCALSAHATIVYKGMLCCYPDEPFYLTFPMQG